MRLGVKKQKVFFLGILDSCKTTVVSRNKIHIVKSQITRYLLPTIVMYLFIKGFNVQYLITKAVLMIDEVGNTNEKMSQPAYHLAHSGYTTNISQIELN